LIGGGNANIASGYRSVIGGGYLNRSRTNNSAILGGQRNDTSTFDDVMIVGSCITADRACTLFANNLSIKNIPTSAAGLPSGSVYRTGSALCIVP
jgi:hypothetical protein